MKVLDWHRFRGLYGIVDVAAGEADRARELAMSLVRGGARVLQLRMKTGGAGEMLQIAQIVGRISREAGRPFVVNDRLDVAMAVNADAVHLGQDDLPIAAARTALARAGREMMIGVSTHNLEQVRAAVAGGADYLGFGPIFNTRSKENPDPVVGIAGLAAACKLALPVPVVAIGGIGFDETPLCAQAGATCVAVIRYVNAAPDPEVAARQIAHAFESSGTG